MPAATPDSASDIRYRLATEGDIPALTRLIELSVETFGLAHYSPEQLASALEYVFGVDRQLIADGTYFVAESPASQPALGALPQLLGSSGLQLVGCGGWSRRRRLFGKDSATWNGDPAQALNPAIEPARIRAFFVHPNWARRGIARALLQLCEDAARTNGFRTLELAATLMGEAMYTRCGFVELERVNHALPDGVHLPVVRMFKPLAAATQTGTAPGL